MKLVYDYQIFSSQKYGGISRYFYETATRIAKYEQFEVTILALIYSNEYVRHCDEDLVIGKHVYHVPKTRIIKRLVNTEISRWWMKKNKPDIVHETYYSYRRMSPKNSKTVITVYDMIHEKFGHHFSKLDNTSFLKAKSLKRADHIICISENTRKDLLETFHINPRKVSVIHLGYMQKQTEYQLTTPFIKEPYILYVGNRNAWKNFQGFLKAFLISQRLNSNFKVVCFGGGDLSRKELEANRKHNVKEQNIIQISGNDETLANLYTHASALIYPSLYEGFGLPLLEAMSFQCPVICGNTSSIPEIVGKAAEFFEPHDPESIAHAIEAVVFSQSRVATLREQGTKRVKKFSWDKCIEKTLQVYENLL